MSNACFNFLPSLFLLVLLGASYVIYIYFFCLTFVKLVILQTVFICFSTCFALMILWSFFSTYCSSVGTVPKEYKISREENIELIRARTSDEKDIMLENLCEKHNLLVQTCTTTGRIRFCSICMHIKPDRSHHCSTCDKCFLRMDHHCPWLNNCIGYRNYKSFILLIFYTVLYCFFFAGTSISLIIQTALVDQMKNVKQAIPVCVGFGLAVIMGVVSLFFLCYHLYLTGRNETTLENMYPPDFLDEDMCFDLGVRGNFIEVFGNKWYLWFLPVFSSMGNGYVFLVERK
ncbi:palmitoyltransferase ZDHHC20-A-like [Anthonomus grandis grandis]|uniref:palmitoyltransferase ZDHHC20-A-like n=1 Tax=Anthonomus grandis grandis TaxID=2921223 RepID=UPI00216651CE|nr:palmitoyltransferase ZDHHC20-A-like [Anthonomus grandis grandis]